MFTANNCLVLSLVYIIFSVTQCQCELPLPPPSVHLYSPETSFPEYAEVIVKRFGDSLTLLCEIRNDRIPRVFVWNYVNNEGNPAIHEPLHIESSSKNSSSRLFKSNLTFADSGHYICSAPPYSIKKYVLVQPVSACGSGSLWCGARCVFPSYVCDGRRDCDDGADENVTMCGTTCGENHLSCSDGRCIPTSACCGRQPLCRQPTCCDEHHAFSREGYVEVEYPALFEDRHGPDDYGFIQSTIYTVTACALIFMIAVVLLVSAICKMHMKRAALRSHAARRYTVQAHRFPPCYEASRLLERDGRVSADISPSRSHTSPVRMPEQSCTVSDAPDVSSPPPPTGIARLGALFSSRYTAVPTQPSEVELQNVRCTSLNNSPSRNRDIGDSYRSPTYCDLNTTDFYFTSPETADCGRELNYMATPLEFFRRRTLNRGVLDSHFNAERSRPLTLQLGRFQLSIPRFGRRSSSETERRPDTPNISEINIDELDFVRLNENDTYTLNGRTIRLLGANFENYPVGASRPPPYNEAMRYKVFGPPPEYLSRDVLTDTNTTTNATPDTEAANNVEMPPCYDELASGVSSRLLIVSTDDVQRVINAVERNNTDTSVSTAAGDTDARVNTANVECDSVNNNNNNDSQLFVPSIGTSGTDVENNVQVTPDHTPLNQIIDNLPAIDCDLNANDSTAVA